MVGERTLCPSCARETVTVDGACHNCGESKNGRRKPGWGKSARPRGQASSRDARSGRAETGRAENGRAGSGPAGSKLAGSGLAGSGPAGSRRAETGRPKIGRPKIGRPKIGRPKIGRSEIRHPQSSRGEASVPGRRPAELVDVDAGSDQQRLVSLLFWLLPGALLLVYSLLLDILFLVILGAALLAAPLLLFAVGRLR